MSKLTANSLFIDFSLQRFYQQLFSGIANYRELGNRITGEIKAVHAFRNVKRVQELSQVLINIPIKEFQLIGEYYLIWCKSRNSQYHTDALDTIAEQIQTYKTQVLLSRGTFEVYQGKPEPALYFYSEALKATRTASDYIGSLLAVAVIKSIEGFHTSAMRDLEKLVPIIKHAEPRLYYDFLNSYAVELGEAGRTYEARNISHIVLSSPFAYAYPEWQDTANDLRGSQKSFVSISSCHYLPRNVFLMPTTRHDEIATRLDKPARVLDLLRWKSKMSEGKKQNGDEQKPVEEMNTSEMLRRAMQLFSDRSIPEEKRREMMKAIERILATPDKPEPDKPKPDDEHGA